MTTRVYLIRSADKNGKLSYYAGVTNNPARRLAQHQGLLKGGAKYLAGRHDLTMRLVASFSTRGEALSHECAVKKWSVHQKAQAFVAGTEIEMKSNEQENKGSW